MRFCFIILCITFLTPVALCAKRIPAKPVKPVSANGITYSAEGDGKNGYVVATQTSTQKELWRVRIFKVHIKFWLGEEDVQWVYITDLRIAGNSLLVRNEKARCYDLDLTKRKSRRTSCPADWQTADRK